MEPGDTFKAIEDNGGDLLSLYARADKVFRLAIEGVEQEKVSVKDGVLTVIERNLATAVSAIRQMSELRKQAKEEASATASDTVLIVKHVLAEPTED